MNSEHHASSTPETTTTDVIVIGGGPVGENVAQYATEDTDLEAVIVEQELLGGECSYYACIPSKTLLTPITRAHATAHLPGLSPARIEPGALLERRDEWVSHYDDTGQVDWAESAGIPVVRGHARLTGERDVLVDSSPPRLLRARHGVVIATGSTPVIPETLADVMPWTSRDATGVQVPPRELLIIGGGVVAVEAATWMAALGTQVRMLVRGDRLLAGTEPFAGRHVAGALEAAGVRIDPGTEVTAARRENAAPTSLGHPNGGRVTVTVAGPDGESEISADEILVATGRRPRLDDLGLDAIGLSPDDVTTNSLPSWLHAVGDAGGQAPLTHWGKYRARVVGARIRADALGEDAEPVPQTVPVPQVVFTDPQVASVGMTEAQARSASHAVETAQVPFNASAGTALLRDDADGTAQIVVDAEQGLLLGATFVGPEASELIHPATVAIVGRVPVHTLRHAVPSFPTSSELWLQLLESLPRRLRHVPD